MRNISKIAALVLALGLLAAPAQLLAADEAGAKPAAGAPAAAAVKAPDALILGGAACGAGLIIIGAAYGIGKIGSSAVESMARQPEVAGNINTAMIVAAALIEGVTFFALIVALLTLIIK